MAVKVIEGVDYRLLEDNYRQNFHKSYRPYKTLNDGTVLHKCVYCGEIVAVGTSYKNNDPMEVDHIIPKTRLGAGIVWNPNKAWNLAPSCKSCNTSKSNYIDMRVIKGFTNKLKYKYHLGALMNTDEVSKEETKVSKAFTTTLVALVTLLTIVSPLIIIASWILQGTFSLVRRIFNLTLKLTRKIRKRFVRGTKKVAGNIAQKIISVILVVWIFFVVVAYVKTGNIELLAPAQQTYAMLKNLFNQTTDLATIVLNYIKIS